MKLDLITEELNAFEGVLDECFLLEMGNRVEVTAKEMRANTNSN